MSGVECTALRESVLEENTGPDPTASEHRKGAVKKGHRIKKSDCLMDIADKHFV